MKRLLLLCCPLMLLSVVGCLCQPCSPYALQTVSPPKMGNDQLLPCSACGGVLQGGYCSACGMTEELGCDVSCDATCSTSCGIGCETACGMGCYPGCGLGEIVYGVGSLALTPVHWVASIFSYGTYGDCGCGPIIRRERCDPCDNCGNFVGCGGVGCETGCSDCNGGMYAQGNVQFNGQTGNYSHGNPVMNSPVSESGYYLENMQLDSSAVENPQNGQENIESVPTPAGRPVSPNQNTSGQLLPIENEYRSNRIPTSLYDQEYGAQNSIQNKNQNIRRNVNRLSNQTVSRQNVAKNSSVQFNRNASANLRNQNVGNSMQMKNQKQTGNQMSGRIIPVSATIQKKNLPLQNSQNNRRVQTSVPQKMMTNTISAPENALRTENTIQFENSIQEDLIQTEDLVQAEDVSNWTPSESRSVQRETEEQEQIYSRPNLQRTPRVNTKPMIF